MIITLLQYQPTRLVKDFSRYCNNVIIIFVSLLLLLSSSLLLQLPEATKSYDTTATTCQDPCSLYGRKNLEFQHHQYFCHSGFSEDARNMLAHRTSPLSDSARKLLGPGGDCIAVLSNSINFRMNILILLSLLLQSTLS